MLVRWLENNNPMALYNKKNSTILVLVNSQHVNRKKVNLVIRSIFMEPKVPISLSGQPMRHAAREIGWSAST